MFKIWTQSLTLPPFLRDGEIFHLLFHTFEVKTIITSLINEQQTVKNENTAQQLPWEWLDSHSQILMGKNEVNHIIKWIFRLGSLKFVKIIPCLFDSTPNGTVSPVELVNVN